MSTEAPKKDITQLWAESDAIVAEIANNPLKFPWQWLNMWLDGQLPSKEK